MKKFNPTYEDLSTAMACLPNPSIAVERNVSHITVRVGEFDLVFNVTITTHPQEDYVRFEWLYTGPVACAGLEVDVPQEEQKKERLKAPWPDFWGNDIFEGDTIGHPSGETGTVVFLRLKETPEDAWRVIYPDGTMSRLGLQVGAKGQAMVLKRGGQ